MTPSHRPSLFRRASAAFAAAVVVAGCSTKVERIEASLRRGAEHVRAADWDKAGVEVRNVLQMDPKNAHAYLVGAQVAEGQRDVQRAYGSYLKAVELDPTLLEAKVGLARIYLLADRVPLARSQIDEVLKAEPSHLGARTLQVALTARGGNAEAAIAEGHALLAAQPRPPGELTQLLAGLHANRGELGEAARLVDAALTSDPKNLGLLQIAAQLAADPRADASLAARAPDFFRRAAAQAPKNADAWNAWAAYHARRGEADAAERVLRDSLAAQPDDAKRRLALLEYVAQRRGHDAAEKEFRAAIAQHPKDTDLRFALVALHRSAGRDAAACEELRAIVDLAPKAPAALQARTQLAAYRLAAAENGEARELLAEVLQASPHDSAALLLRGRLELREGHAREAVVDLRAALRDQPGAPEVVGALAQAHLLAGEPDLAREVLSDAVKFRPEDVQLRLLLAAYLADAKQLGEADAQLVEALRLAPRMPGLYEARASLQVAQNDAAAAEKTLISLRDALPAQSVGYLRLAQFYVQRKRLDAAVKTLDQGAAAVPGDPALALAAISVLASQKRFSEIEARADKMQRAEPEGLLPYQVRGDLALLRKDGAAAEAAFRKIVEMAPAGPVGYQGVARARALRGDGTGALEVLQQGIAANPDDLRLAGYRAEWLVRAGRREEAIQAYEALLARAPGDEGFNNNLAYLLIEAKGDPASLQRALQLTGRFAESRNPSYLDSLGWVHYRLGEFDKAVPLLERAVALQPASALLTAHLGLALVRKGDTERGQGLLKRVLSAKADIPDADEVRRLAGPN